MKREAWFKRLGKQLPGWHVWHSSPGGWFAVPAPPTATHDEILRLPNRLGPFKTPQELRTEALDRYGWDDECETCLMPARECGHRQPERTKETK